MHLYLAIPSVSTTAVEVRNGEGSSVDNTPLTLLHILSLLVSSLDECTPLVTVLSCALPDLPTHSRWLKLCLSDRLAARFLQIHHGFYGKRGREDGI